MLVFGHRLSPFLFCYTRIFLFSKVAPEHLIKNFVFDQKLSKLSPFVFFLIDLHFSAAEDFFYQSDINADVGHDHGIGKMRALSSLYPAGPKLPSL
jgi:hypothetical protein